jgi:hypothetical protein
LFLPLQLLVLDQTHPKPFVILNAAKNPPLLLPLQLLVLDQTHPKTLCHSERSEEPPHLLLPLQLLVLAKKPSKFTCQAPKPQNPLPAKNIPLAFKLGPICYS